MEIKKNRQIESSGRVIGSINANDLSVCLSVFLAPSELYKCRCLSVCGLWSSLCNFQHIEHLDDEKDEEDEEDEEDDDEDDVDDDDDEDKVYNRRIG